jgi:all-trans-retinol 13,14-reductase
LNKNTVKHFNHNVYYSKDNNVWADKPYTDSTWPNGYMMYSTEDDENQGFAESVVVLAMMKYSDVEQWKDSLPMKRAKEYAEFKEKKTNQLIDLLNLQFPEIKGNIKSIYSASPLTYRDYTGTHEGSIYGIVKDSNSPFETFLSPKTKIPNLLLTGQNVNVHGILGVMMTSFQTLSSLIDVNQCIEEIRNFEK